MAKDPSPRNLVVGGAEVSVGTERLCAHQRLRLDAFAFEITTGAETELEAGTNAVSLLTVGRRTVVIQSVLKQVLDPERIINNDSRVLGNDTPFRPQEYEGPADSTRLTESPLENS